MKRAGTKRPTRLDEVAVIEAAYRLEGSESSWLRGVAEVAVELLDEGWGVTASTWRGAPDAIQLRSVVSLGGPAGFGEAAERALRDTTRRSSVFRSRPRLAHP
jgi:hypothetical protein